MKLTVLEGNVFEKIKEIQDESVDLCITSPPYWGLRDYGSTGQLGLEPTMEDYLDNMVKWIKETWRVLKPSGSFVLNIGDCFFTKRNEKAKEQVINSLGYSQRRSRFSAEYGYYKSKQLLSVSSFAYCKILSETDFVCRGEHLWLKPNVPSPIRSRLKHSHEKLFWFVKDTDKYYFDKTAWMKKVSESSQARSLRATLTNPKQGSFSNKQIHENIKGQEQPKNEETIEHSWRVIPVGEKQKGFELYDDNIKQEHVAPFPSALIIPYVQSLCPENGTILDPFLGSGTTMRIAMENNRNCIGIEINPNYVEYAKKRCNWKGGLGIEYIG